MIFATAWNISADIALLIVPFLIIPKTQIPLRRKILINCVLGLGVFNVSIAFSRAWTAFIVLIYPRYSQPSSIATTTSLTPTRYNTSSGM
jgi:hypothetical protein